MSTQEEQRMVEVGVRLVSLNGGIGVDADEFVSDMSSLLQETGRAKFASCADSTGEDCDPAIDDCEIHLCKNDNGTYRLVFMNGREDQPEVQMWLEAYCAKEGYAVEFVN